MRTGETQRKETLNVLRAAVKKEEIDARVGGESAALDDAGVMRVIEREAKKRRDAAAEYEKYGRADRAALELAELAILQEFLPAQLSDEGLDSIVRDAIAESGATGPADMGKVMPVVMARAAGQADGKRISGAVRKLLAG